MRDNVHSFVQSAARAFRPPGPVYEFGSYQVEGQEGLGNLRGLFPGRPYVGCDMRPGPGVDRVEDVAHVDLPDETAGTIVCVDTLEHVYEVAAAVAEMIRLLKPGGLLLISVPMDFRIHAYPDDYWRLTPSCVSRLLAPLAASVIGSQGVESYPHTVFGIGCKAPLPADVVTGVERFLKSFQSHQTAAAAAVPQGNRIKNWLRGFAASKGHRRRERDYFQTRFSLHMATKTANPLPQRSKQLGFLPKV